MDLLASECKHGFAVRTTFSVLTLRFRKQACSFRYYESAFAFYESF